jgi:predicted acetyltransferase
VARDRQQPVPVSIRDALNSPRDRQWIQAQYPEYLEDLSLTSMNTGVFPATREVQTELMARWFADDSSYPLIILKNEHPAGFALVSRPPRNRRDQVDFRMAEFFIAMKSRRLGIGRDAAQLIFNRFAGSWEITEFLHNKIAVNFWRAILMEYTGGKYQEKVAHGEVRQTFKSEHRQRTR